MLDVLYVGYILLFFSFLFSFRLSDTDCNSACVLVGLWVQQASVIPLVSLAYSLPFLVRCSGWYRLVSYLRRLRWALRRIYMCVCSDAIPNC